MNLACLFLAPQPSTTPLMSSISAPSPPGAESEAARHTGREGREWWGPGASGPILGSGSGWIRTGRHLGGHGWHWHTCLLENFLSKPLTKAAPSQVAQNWVKSHSGVQCMTSVVAATSHSDLGYLQKPSGKMPTTDFQNRPLPSPLSITPQSIYFLLASHPAPSLSSMSPSPDRPVLSLCCLSLCPKQRLLPFSPSFHAGVRGSF